MTYISFIPFIFPSGFVFNDVSAYNFARFSFGEPLQQPPVATTCLARAMAGFSTFVLGVQMMELTL